MKKLFKRIALLICIITLFSVPSTAFAATSAISSTSQPVLIYDSDEILEFQFLPSVLEVATNQSHFFKNVKTSSNDWVVPAGKNFAFSMILTDANGNSDDNAGVLVTIVKNNVVQSQEVYVGSGPSLFFPADSQDNTYMIIITALNKVHLYKYYMFLY